jgi:hypothetical protein
VTILGSTLVPFPAIESAKVDYLAASGEASSERAGHHASTRSSSTSPRCAHRGAHPTRAGRRDITEAVDAATAAEGTIVEVDGRSSRPGAIRFPIAMFEEPALRRATPITVDDDGHVFGHLALWGQCHTGFDRECVLAPRSQSNYAQFRLGSAHTTEGTTQPVGTISLGGGHADEKLSLADMARAHYDSTSTAAAYVNVGEDSYGIWVSGVLKPGLTDEKVTEFCAASLSGDWRKVGGNLELIAALAVNVPGFPVARVVNGEAFALVAAGYGHRKPTVSALEARLSHVARTTEERLAISEDRVTALTEKCDALDRQLRPILAERMSARFTSTDE